MTSPKPSFVWITQKQDRGMEKGQVRYYECPDCETINIAWHFNFCPSCGIRLRWRKDV